MASQTLPAITGDKDRSLQEVLNRLTASRAPLGAEAEPIVTAAHRMPAVPATFAPYPEGTDQRLCAALAARGIDQLYTHQAEAFGHVLAGRNVVTITPTASGKTLCYNAPVLNAILQDSSTRALYLFPTKALAQDQLAELHALVQLVGDTDSACGPSEAPEGSGAERRRRASASGGGAPRAVRMQTKPSTTSFRPAEALRSTARSPSWTPRRRRSSTCASRCRSRT
jgi:hypothetical protein